MENLKLKLIIFGIIALVLIGFYFAWQQKNKTIDTLKTTVTEQKVENGSLVDTNTKIAKSDQITEQTNTNVANQTNDIVIKQDTIKKKAEDKIRQIENNYTHTVAHPPSSTKSTVASQSSTTETPEPILLTEKQKNEAISLVIIDSLWDSYCSGMPNASSCVKTS